MHEFVADAAAIGALQHIDDLARRGRRKAEHAVHIDRRIHVFRMEAVERRIELRLRRLGIQIQRIEIGGEMADHAIGAHHLHGANGFVRGGMQIGFARGAGFGCRPLAGEGADRVAGFQREFAVPPPRGAAAQLCRGQPTFAQFGEPLPPGRIHRVGVLLILGIELFEEGCVGA